MDEMFHAERNKKKGKLHSIYYLRCSIQKQQKILLYCNFLKEVKSLFFPHQGIMEPAEPVHIGESQGFMAEGKPVEPIKVSWNPRNQSKIKVLWRGNP